MNISIVKANYLDEVHGNDIRLLLDAYAKDPMGGGKELSKNVIDNIVAELAKLPHAFSVIGYIDGKPVGLANCFDGFSTFVCKPLVNIHDFVVLEKYRGKGISQKILEKVEEIAKLKGCCKVTLEVLSNNEAAKSSYKKFGFSGYELDPKVGGALFWHKEINRT